MSARASGRSPETAASASAVFGDRVIEVVASWLQDLSGQLDRRMPAPAAADREGARPALEARMALAETLRDATERIVSASARRS